jgi:hypothetical protein
MTRSKSAAKGKQGEDSKPAAIKKADTPAKYVPPAVRVPVATLTPATLSSFASATSSSKGPPVKGLDSFGITGSPSGGAFAAKKVLNQNEGFLKCCVIQAPNKWSMVFRLEDRNVNYDKGFYGERFLKDARNKEWFRALMFKDTFPYWYHENVPVLNHRGFNIRMFIIQAEGKVPANSALINVGHEICSHLNAVEGNPTTTRVNEADYFWLNDTAVWADVLGNEAAANALKEETGPKCPGYYNVHKTTIHTYFHPGSFSLEMAKDWDAPISQVHPSLRNDTDVNKENEDDVFSLDDTDDEME